MSNIEDGALTESAMVGEPLLRVSELDAGYAFRRKFVHAVRSVSFEVGANDFFGIAGESGCGKTTLVLALLKLLKRPGVIRGGKVEIAGVDVLRLADEELRRLRWKVFSFVPQSSMNSLNPVMRIGDQMADVLIRNFGYSHSDAFDAVRSALELVNIKPERMDNYPHQLSGGMRQRVVIAMALLLSPKLVVMDEPTTALDVVVQRSILQQIEDLRKAKSFATVFITHDISLLFELATTLAIMYAGEFVEVGPARLLFERPLHPYTKGLIEALPSISGELREYKSIPGKPPDLASGIVGCPFKDRCPFVFDTCQSEKPQLLKIEGRWVSCHLYR